MGPWASLALALALSLDSLAVGVLYGARGIRITQAALLIISLASALALATAMAAGTWLGGYVTPATARWAGAMIMAAAGVWSCWQAWRTAGNNGRPHTPPAPQRGSVELFTWHVPFVHLVVRVLAEPAAADLDHSGTINPGEAMLLGAALAADSLGAGLGAGLAGFSAAALAPLTAAGGWLGLAAGMAGGRRLPWRLEGRWGMVHGFLLICIGMYRLLR